MLIRDSKTAADTGYADIDFNLVADADTYKNSHPSAYPTGLDGIFSYIEDRQGAKFDCSLVFGFQYFIKRYLARGITRLDIDEAEALAAEQGVPFDRDRWDHIVKEHGGDLPLRIRVIPEGSLVNVGNLLAAIEPTDPKCAWLPGHIETVFLNSWAPRACATQSFYAKLIIGDFLARTTDPETVEAYLKFMLHDFGARGVTCPEQAGVMGMAHLVNWWGTDTIAAMRYARRFYPEHTANKKREPIAFSVPALEHATVLSFGPGWENELTAMRHALGTFAKRGFKVVSCIADTNNVWKLIKEGFCGELLEEIQALHAEYGLKVVIRLDSGNPIETVPRALNLIKECLGTTNDRKTGCWVNSKGFLMLPDFFGVLQGDGVGLASIGDILGATAAKGWSVANIVFGWGGENLHKGVNRDTQRTAMKPSQVRVNGVTIDVSKKPIDDPYKRSKEGRLDVYRDENGDYHTVKLVPGVDSLPNSVLVEVFRDGVVTAEWSFSEVRERAAGEYHTFGTYYLYAGTPVK